MDYRPKCNTGNHEFLEENIGSVPFDISIRNMCVCAYIYIGYVSSGKENKSKNKKMELN